MIKQQSNANAKHLSYFHTFYKMSLFTKPGVSSACCLIIRSKTHHCQRKGSVISTVFLFIWILCFKSLFGIWGICISTSWLYNTLPWIHLVRNTPWSSFWEVFASWCKCSMITKAVNAFLTYMCLETESLDFKTSETEEGDSGQMTHNDVWTLLTTNKSWSFSKNQFSIIFCLRCMGLVLDVHLSSLDFRICYNYGLWTVISSDQFYNI